VSQFLAFSRVASTGRASGLTTGAAGADAVWVMAKLALVALSIVALAAVFVWVGGPGRFAAVGLAMAAWRYFLWGDGDG
jgi:hypothetical protein